MGRKKKTLHDYAAEFSELAVKRHLLERGAAGEAAAVVETLYCTPCHLPLQLDAPSLLIQPSFILAASADTSTSYGMDPSPPSYHKPLVPQHPSTTSSPASAATPREDPTPSTSARHPSALATSHMRIVPTPLTAEASNGPMPALGHGSDSNSVGLALFGIGLINKGLFQSLMEENGCCLLYVVADQLEEVERAFGAEFLPVETQEFSCRHFC
uniref:Uncharacterized protein n=1 Tax=Falco tinnunculus TaxID=100819 RepID=A0A8C4V2W7_FALTI